MDSISLTVHEVKVLINMLQLLIWGLERRGHKTKDYRSSTLKWVDGMKASLTAKIQGKSDQDLPQ